MGFGSRSRSSPPRRFRRRRFRTTCCNNSRAVAWTPLPDRLISRRLQLVSFYKRSFSLYGNTAGTPLPVLGCPLTAMGLVAGGNPPNGNGCANRQSVFAFERRSRASANRSHRLQHRRSEHHLVPVSVRHRSSGAAYTDPINPLFNAVSPQPFTHSRRATRTSSPRVW